MSKNQKIVVALAGNPNSGKTTLFNNLTGARQHVGNYPGVTVEKKSGTCHYQGRTIEVVDLPGTYSLTAYSPEEMVARRFLVEEKPDAVIAVVDSSNLERNLYLALQLLELNVPLVLACNMVDIVKSKGDQLDLEKLSRALGTPAVATVGNKRRGMDELLAKTIELVDKKSSQAQDLSYSADFELAIQQVETSIRNSGMPLSGTARWNAIKLLENDEQVVQEWKGILGGQTATRVASELAEKRGEPIETIVAQERYDLLSRVCASVITSNHAKTRSASDRLDAVLTHRIWGLPIFLAAMFVVFWATFNIGGIPSDWIETGTSKLGDVVSGLWVEGSQSPLRSLLVDGVIAGVGGVITFLPNILVLFLAIGLLEDSGYMPRAAFIMDRLMNKIGLHGKSFIPLLLGFGCSVPAIMATRTLENRRDRLTTMLVAPLMSCGARLPIYALIIPAFFPQTWQAPVLWLIYFVGIVLAIVSAKLLRSTFLKGTATPFVMELPPYRIPSLRDSFLHMLERSGLYLRKAGTIILAISMLLWVLTSYPKPPKERAHLTNPETVSAVTTSSGIVSDSPAVSEAEEKAYDLTYSFAGRIGKTLEPVLKPMGFDWKIGTALIGAVAAKEVFVAQMGIVYSTGSTEDNPEPLQVQLKKTYRPLVGLCIMLFCLISAPCMATFAVTKRESGGWRWALLQFAGLTVFAYTITTAVYQIGRIAGF